MQVMGPLVDPPPTEVGKSPGMVGVKAGELERSLAGFSPGTVGWRLQAGVLPSAGPEPSLPALSCLHVGDPELWQAALLLAGEQGRHRGAREGGPAAQARPLPTYPLHPHDSLLGL